MPKELQKTAYKLEVPTALWLKFKSKCALENVSMLEKIIQLITSFVK